MSNLRGAAIHAEIELTACSGEICVNGIPVDSCPAAQSDYRQSIQVNTFVVPNLNQLELALHIDPEAPSRSRRARKSPPAKGASAVGRLVRYPITPGTFASPQHGEVLASFSWSAADDSSDAAPREFRALVDLGEAFGRRAWQDAPELALDTATRQEAITLLEEIRATMRRGDADAMLRLIDIKFREGAASYSGIDLAKTRASFARWLSQFAAEPDRVLPLDLDQLDLRLAAERRIIVPTTRRWQGAIVLRLPRRNQDGELLGEIDVPYEVMFARVNGMLRVVA